MHLPHPSIPDRDGVDASSASTTAITCRVVRNERDRSHLIPLAPSEHDPLTEPWPAILAGRWRHQHPDPGDQPVVGDLVLATAGSPAVIHQLLPRRNVLQRVAAGSSPYVQVLAANLDHLLVMCGLDEDFNPRRLERYLVLAGSSGIRPVIVLTKADLVADPRPILASLATLDRQVPVLAISARTGTGLEKLQPFLQPGHLLAVVGSSGAGKSTLINRLAGTTDLATGAVRDHDSHGRHTTTARQLVPLPGGAAIIDTPGLREIQFLADDDTVAGTFDDIADLSRACRFRDCRHQDEPGCAVKAAIDDDRLDPDRLTNLIKMKKESQRAERKITNLARRAKTARERHHRQTDRVDWTEDDG